MAANGLFEMAEPTVLLAHYAVIVAVLWIGVYRYSPEFIFAIHPQIVL